MRTKARSTAGSQVVRLAEGGPEAQDEPGARNQGTESRLQSIAIDVGQHFSNNFKGTGLKASLWLRPSGPRSSLRNSSDSFGMVTAEVVISAPEMR
jgi:hypothetical protein